MLGTVPILRIDVIDNTRLLWLLGIISWHAGRCGENVRCLPGVLPGIIGEGTGFIASLPKLVGVSALSGLMILTGSVAQGPAVCENYWQRTGTVIALGAFVHVVVAPIWDGINGGPIPTNGHVWFMYAVAVGRVLVKINHSLGGNSSTCMAAAILINVLAPLAWSFVVAAFPVHAGGANFEGITWSSGEWFVPFGVRCFTSVPFFVLGTYYLTPSAIMEMHAAAWSSCWFKQLIVPLNIACCAYSLFRLELRDQLHFHSASPANWLNRLPRHAELMVFCVGAPVLLLLLIPNRDLGLITWAGRNTLIPYLFHPFLLKIIRPVWIAITALCVKFVSPGDLGILLALQQLITPIVVFAILAMSTRALGLLIRGILYLRPCLRLRSLAQRECWSRVFLFALACWPLHLMTLGFICFAMTQRGGDMLDVGPIDMLDVGSASLTFPCSQRERPFRIRQVVPANVTAQRQLRRCSVFAVPIGFNITHMVVEATRISMAVQDLSVHACNGRTELMPTRPSFPCLKPSKREPSLKGCESSALLAWSRKRGHTQNSEQRKVLVRTKALVLHVHYRACTAHGCATTPELLVSDIPVRLACKQ